MSCIPSSSHSAISLNFFNTLSSISTSHLIVPAMYPSPQFVHLDSFGNWFVLSLMWSSSPQFRQNPFRLYLAFVCPYLWQLFTYYGLVLVLVFSGIWWLSGEIHSIWLLLQVEGRNSFSLTVFSSTFWLHLSLKKLRSLIVLTSYGFVMKFNKIIFFFRFFDFFQLLF